MDQKNVAKSKRKRGGPVEALETYGADAIRCYFYVNSATLAAKSRFHGKAVRRGQRKVYLAPPVETRMHFSFFTRNIDVLTLTKYTRGVRSNFQ